MLGCCRPSHTLKTFCVSSSIQHSIKDVASSNAQIWILQVARAQDGVNAKLHMLEMHQKETHDSLLQMERTAISMYQVRLQQPVTNYCGLQQCHTSLLLVLGTRNNCHLSSMMYKVRRLPRCCRKFLCAVVVCCALISLFAAERQPNSHCMHAFAMQIGDFNLHCRMRSI